MEKKVTPSCGHNFHVSCDPNLENINVNRCLYCPMCTLITLPFNQIIDDEEFKRTIHAAFNYNRLTNAPPLEDYIFDPFLLNDDTPYTY